MKTVRECWWLGLMLPLCLLAGSAIAEEAEADGGGVLPGSRAMPGNNPARHVSGPGSRDAMLVRQHPDSARWLEAGDARIAIMETAASTADARGTVVIITDAGQTAAQGLAGEMHRVFPTLGWRVISMAPPPLPLPAHRGSDGNAPEPEDSGEDALPQADEDSRSIAIDLATPEPGAEKSEAFIDQAQSRIGAVMETVGEDGSGAKLMIGIGLGAATLTRWLADNPASENPLALVWLVPQFQGFGTDNQADSPAPWLQGKRPWPILDITDSRYHQPLAKTRRLAMQNLEGEAQYRQDAFIIFRDSGHEAHRLGHRIHGWALQQLGIEP